LSVAAESISMNSVSRQRTLISHTNNILAMQAFWTESARTISFVKKELNPEDRSVGHDGVNRLENHRRRHSGDRHRRY